MIHIKIEDVEYYNQDTEEFVTIRGGTYTFEHSLYAISRWEAKWKEPYLNKTDFTMQQGIDYYRFMCSTIIREELITLDVVNQLSDYIEDKRTATTIQNDSEKKPGGKILTSEVIYGMMAIAQIPFECEFWNINRLFVLLSVVADAHAPKKKMTKEEIFQQNAKLNAERKKQYNTKG